MADDLDLVQVFVADSDVEAVMYRSLLEEAGIEVYEQALGDTVIFNVAFRGVPMQYGLSVRADDAECARQLVRDFEAQAESGRLASEIPPNAKDDAEND